jgi:hypothetical protein
MAMRCGSRRLLPICCPLDPLLTIPLCAQLLATGGDGFGLSRPFRPLLRLRRIAAVCARSAPRMLHVGAGQLGTNTWRGGDGLDCCSEEPPVGARRFAANAAIAVAASSAREFSTSVAASSRRSAPMR